MFRVRGRGGLEAVQKAASLPLYIYIYIYTYMHAIKYYICYYHYYC